MNQFDAADLQRRRKELDVREEALVEKEKLLKDILDDTDTTALEETYRVKEVQLQVMQDKIDKTATLHAQRLSELKQKEERLQGSINDLVNAKQTADRELGNIRTAIGEAAKTLRSSKQEIGEQRKYYKEQQTLTQEAINSWNIELQEFAQAMSIEHRKKSDLLEENRALEGIIRATEEEFENLQAKLSLLEERFTERSNQLRNELLAIHEEIRLVTIEKETITVEMGKRKRKLDIRERELDLQKQAANKKEEDLVLRERRVQSNAELL